MIKVLYDIHIICITNSGLHVIHITYIILNESKKERKEEKDEIIIRNRVISEKY